MNDHELITAGMRQSFPPAMEGAPNIEVVMTPVGGLTKREWFAGMALQGFCGNSAIVTTALPEEGYWLRVSFRSTKDDHVAARCYELADAMIAAGKGGA